MGKEIQTEAMEKVPVSENRDSFWKEEDGVGVVEIILILVVLISLVLIFKKQLTNLVRSIFSQINSQAGEIY